MLAGPESEPRKASEIFNAAKSENKYPKDVVRIEIWGETRGRVAIAICHKANAKYENKISEAIKSAEEKQSQPTEKKDK